MSASGVGALQISIHTLRVEGDRTHHLFLPYGRRFLSTPSVWRVTVDALREASMSGFLSTPSVWRVTGPTLDRAMLY